MPYHWTETPTQKSLKLWPHQSLTDRGFSWFIGVTAAMLALPLLAVLGSPVAWVLLVFFVLALVGVWQAIQSNRRARSLHEELVLADETLRLQHVPPSGQVLEWEENPYWVSVHLRDDGPVEEYLTLRGIGREVEIGRFLTPGERKDLHAELNAKLRSC